MGEQNISAIASRIWVPKKKTHNAMLRKPYVELEICACIKPFKFNYIVICIRCYIISSTTDLRIGNNI